MRFCRRASTCSAGCVPASGVLLFTGASGLAGFIRRGWLAPASAGPAAAPPLASLRPAAGSAANGVDARAR